MLKIYRYWYTCNLVVGNMHLDSLLEGDPLEGDASHGEAPFLE